MVKTAKTKMPFGLWEPNITAENVVSKAMRFSSLQSTGHYLYWCEQRSQEKGRGVIMRWSKNRGLVELLPPPFSARSKVHEYGGGEFCIADGKIYFVNDADQQIYFLSEGNEPTQITNAPDFRFADMTYDHARDRLVVVAERHNEQHALPQNMLVNIGLSGAELGGVSIMDDSCDFYSSPTISPNHNQLAWLQWNLPHMPWEAAELKISSLVEPNLTPEHVAGGPGSACFQPTWDKSNQLFFISEMSGTGQLYKLTTTGETIIERVPEQSQSADALRPQWVFGMGSYAISQTSQIAISAYLNGQCQLQIITDDQANTIETKALSIETPHFIGDDIAAIITSDQYPPSIGIIDATSGEVEILQAGSSLNIDQADISKGQPKEFAGKQGNVYGLYYPPTHSTMTGDENSLPPAIITIHGGPTAMADRGLKMKSQYWTNKGYAVFDVDYAGSSGYGQDYRNRLNGAWGEADVNDIISAADYLIEEKLADPDKLIVSGGSAGGYTCLMALIKSDLFKCASCNYPVTDLAQLLEITHKFEYGYTYALTGTRPETAKEELSAKSVLSHMGKISAPVIFFQGEEDKVVPPAQPEAVYNAMLKKNIHSKMFLFKNEGHGFRQAETVLKVLEEEETFFKEALNLTKNS